MRLSLAACRREGRTMAKKNKADRKKQYSKKFFKTPFPPHHNPLIGSLQKDTLHNVHDAIATLQELTISCEQDQLVLSEYATGGLFYLLECVGYALRFELYHRK